MFYQFFKVSLVLLCIRFMKFIVIVIQIHFVLHCATCLSLLGSLLYGSLLYNSPYVLSHVLGFQLHLTAFKFAWISMPWIEPFIRKCTKKVREKSIECHNYKPQPYPDTKRKRKQTKPNMRKSNKRTKSTKISSLFPKRGNRNAKRTEKHKNKITRGKT